MKFLSRLLWKSVPRRERDQLLYLVPDQDRQAFVKALTGRSLYRACFDRQRCIFVHIPKCAGSSLAEGLLGQRNIGHIPLYWHQLADPERFDDYFKFAFVRNPWDRLVSAYLYLQRGGAPRRDRGWSRLVQRFPDFDAFVQHWLSPENARRSLLFLPQHEFVCDRFGLPGVDFIGRFENLAEDFASVAACLAMPARLPEVNRSPERQPYQEYYTQASRELVAQVYARDLQWFGYRFEGGWTPTPWLPESGRPAIGKAPD